MTLQDETSNLSMRASSSNIAHQLEEAAVRIARQEKLQNDAFTSRISSYQDQEYSSKLKVDLQPPTEQSSKLYDSATHAQTYGYSSKPITGLQSSSGNGTRSGPQEMALNQQSESRSLTSGLAKALTYDSGKAPLANLPWAAVEALSRVQLYGHSKYKDFNNYRKGMEVTRNLSCALRHIKEYLEGKDVDQESGENPLAHAMCRVAFVLQNLHDNTAIDDRYKS